MPADNNRLENIFLAASEIPEAERSAYLNEACGADTELRAGVVRLLAAHADPASILKPSVDPLPPTDCHTPQPDAGTTLVGRYTLLEEIGEGGMGTVWMARQSEPVKRMVAVKLIKPGMDSKMVLARFEAERQALAIMDHTNIARVFDAGVTDDGRPFFVMELVKGVPITQFCDSRRMTPRERLELIVPVCQAVQHAHQKGVIHRDLKPSNVLVALSDDKPVPKVIDFGVAKAIGQPLTDQTLHTGFGTVIGTPQYMSPEQATFNNLDVDTRSDLYSLGVILYELLAGSTPFTKKELRDAGVMEMLRVVREEEPPRPSTKLSTADALPSLAANRSTEPKKLTGMLKNELDWIVMKALEKDRTRRYETANGFAADILRYLSGEPVQAVPPSTAYRVKKFVRRNRPQVIAVGLIALALVAGIVGTTLGLIEARSQSAEANRQERLARDEAAAKEIALQAEAEQRALAQANARTAMLEKENAVRAAAAETTAKNFAQENQKKAEAALAQVVKGNEILGAVFENLDPERYTTLGELSNILRENLRTAVRELDRAAIGDPLVVAGMQHRLGVSLMGLGSALEAVSLLEKAAGTRTVKLGPGHSSTLASMNSLAVAYLNAGKLNEAIPLLEEIIRLRKAKLPPNHTDTLFSLSNLASAYRLAGKLDKAVPLFEEMLPLFKANLGPEHALTLVSMNNLAQAYQESGKLDKAVPLFEEAFRLWKAKRGPDHHDTLACANNLASAYQAAGKLIKALALFEETLPLLKATLGPDHPRTLTTTNNLAVAYRDVNRQDKAEPLFEEVYRLQKATLGPDHHDTLDTMTNLGLAYQATGKLDRAVPLLEETLRLRRAKFGPDQPGTLNTMNNLGMAYLNAQKPDMAIALFEETLRLRRTKLGSDHLDTLQSMNNIAAAYYRVGKLDKAIPQFEEALLLMRAKLPDHPDTLSTMRNLGMAYQAAGKAEKAVPLFAEALERRITTLGPEHPDTMYSMANLAEAYRAVGKLGLAALQLEKLLQIQKAKLGPDHPGTLETMNNLAGAYYVDGKPQKAVPLLEEALRLRRAALGPDHPDTLRSLANLAKTYRNVGRLDAAIFQFEELLPVQKAKLGTDHPDTLLSMDNLAEAYQAVGKLGLAALQLEKLLQIQKAKLGPDHSDTFGTMNKLAVMNWRMKRLDKSISLFEEALKGQRAKLGRDHPDTLMTAANLGVNYKDAGRLDEAIPLLEEAHRAAKKHPSLRWVGQTLSATYEKAGENAKLASFLLEQLTEARKALPKDSPQLAGQLATTSLSLLQAKAFVEAEALLRESLTIRESAEPDAWTTFNTQSMLGGSLLGQKKYADAEALLLKGYEGMKQRDKSIPALGATRIPEAVDRLIELYTATGQTDDVKKWRAERAKYPPLVAPMPREKR